MRNVARSHEVLRAPRIWGLVALLCCLAACSTAPPPPPPAPPPPSAATKQPSVETPVFVQVGLATWYGRTSQGRRTASGELFDMRAMTAAHRTLGFNTIVRVTNMKNGATIKVRVNDRGPFARGRIIDLSAQAATALGLIDDGAIEVKVEVFASDQPAS